MSDAYYEKILTPYEVRRFLTQRGVNPARPDKVSGLKKVYKVGGSWAVVKPASGDKQKLELHTGGCPC